MPEVHGNHLDVSAEERRYLRRTFHRFALPWLLVAFALGALVGALSRGSDAQPAATASGSGEDPQAREQVGSMRGDVASLSQRLVAAEDSLTKTRDRLAMLEGHSGRGESGGADTAEVDQRLDAIVGRIAALESRAGEIAGRATADPVRLDARLSALDERLARLESDAHTGAHAVAPAANDLE